MTSVDILFWLLIAMLGGVAWAIEGGVAMRHREVLLTSTASVLGSILIIMFWIEDKSEFKLGPRPTSIKRTVTEGEERGQFKYEITKKKKKKSGLGGDEAEEQGAEGKPAEEEEEENEPIEYSKDPFRDCPYCPDLVIVPSGTFEYGSALDDPGRGRFEKPATFITITKPFAVGRLEILRQEYAAFIKETKHNSTVNCDAGAKRRGKFDWQNPGFEQDNRHPVVCVSWKDATLYVAWLSAKTRRSYRLLSEVEWEYVAKAGTKTPYWQGSEISPWMANFNNSRDGTVPGGSMPANKFGLADVSGNVWEFTSECDNSGGVAKPQSGPQIQGANECNRLVKGGGWNSSAAQTRHAARFAIPEVNATNSVGFRVARDIDGRDDRKILTKEEKEAIAAADRAAEEIETKARQAKDKAEKDRIAAEEKAAAEKEKGAAEKK